MIIVSMQRTFLQLQWQVKEPKALMTEGDREREREGLCKHKSINAPCNIDSKPWLQTDQQHYVSEITSSHINTANEYTGHIYHRYTQAALTETIYLHETILLKKYNTLQQLSELLVMIQANSPSYCLKGLSRMSFVQHCIHHCKSSSRISLKQFERKETAMIEVILPLIC